jgi:hypothetical protein
MREKASLASSYQRQQLPAGLMQRLEMMQHLALQAKAQADGQTATASALRPAPRRAQVIVLAWFSLGVMTSGAAGVGALMGLRALEARGVPPTWASLRTALGAHWAAAWARVPAGASVPKPAERTDGPWNRVQVAIDRGARSHVPLGLRVTGGDDRPVYFVLDGVPEGVRPSRGALVGPATWVLGRADLDGLHLTLEDTAPSAFELKIALLAPTGVSKAGSVVQVRLVDGTAPTQAAADPPDQGKAEVPAAPAPSAAVAHAASVPAGTAVARGEDRAARPAAQAQAVGARIWPEGAYGLGAVSRETKGQEGRTAPPPAWSPFQGGAQQP